MNFKNEFYREQALEPSKLCNLPTTVNNNDSNNAENACILTKKLADNKFGYELVLRNFCFQFRFQEQFFIAFE